LPHLEYLKFAPEVCILDVEHLHGPKEVPYGPQELVVLCLVRNGMPWMESFIQHYFSLGIKHIVFLDNGSTDDTVSAASRYENVTVLRSKLRVNAYGGAAEVLMRQYLISRFGKNRWSLCVDIDELFDYPYSDVISLDSLLGYLNSKSFTAVTAHALDMFPEKPLLERADEQDEPLKEVHRFYDLSNLVRWNKQDRPKMLPRFNNTLESDEVEWFAGGIRDKIFGFKPFLTNFPLVFYDGKTWPERPHYVHNARIADITCVLFHYKFVKHFRERTVSAMRDWRNSIVSVEYAKCLEVLDKNPNLQLKHETAREITSVNDLLEDGFLAASDDYVSWVNAEERRSALRSALSEPDGSVETLLECRQQQRVKTLKLERVERQLLRSRRQEEPKPQSLRKLRSQLRDREQTIEELERELRDRDRGLEDARAKQRRLLRKRRQLQSRIVSLERQLESTQGSLARKLVGVLRSVKARIAGSLRRRSA
jgi:glycosyltransferase involved in cell wall biosynthesis